MCLVKQKRKQRKTHKSLKPLKPILNLPGFRKIVESKVMGNQVESTSKQASLPFQRGEAKTGCSLPSRSFGAAVEVGLDPLPKNPCGTWGFIVTSFNSPKHLVRQDIWLPFYIEETKAQSWIRSDEAQMDQRAQDHLTGKGGARV